MARILVNYIYNKGKDEYEILDPSHVYADQKVAIMETEEDIGRPLVVPIRGHMTVVDRDRYEAIHKRFYLTADEKGNVFEDQNGVEVWLPKETDLSRLKYVNGQFVLVEKKPAQKSDDKKEA